MRLGENVRGVAKFDSTLVDLAAAFLNFLSPRGGYLVSNRLVRAFNMPRCYIRRRAEPHTKPDPNATRRTVSPGLTRPVFLAWSNAIGRHAEAIFP